MLYGYLRISTGKQNIERQQRNVSIAYPNAIIIREIYTGTQTNRPEWAKLYKAVKSGDSIIFDSVSRMSRNAIEGFKLYEELYYRGVELIFLKEPHINTSVYRNAIENTVPMTGTDVDYILEGINKYLMSIAKEQIKIAFEQAEKEVKDLHQRTKEGIETARLDGKQIGGVKGRKLTVRKSAPIKKIIFEKSKRFTGSNSDAEVIAIINSTKYYDEKVKRERFYNISRNTYYKYKAELEGELCHT